MKKFLALTVTIFCFGFNAFTQVPSYTVNVGGVPGTGYYFISPLANGGSENLHVLIDSIGRLVCYKQFFGPNTFDFKLQPNGLISYARQSKFYMMDSTFTIVDSVSCKNGVATDFHDMQILPNGHFLMMGDETVNMDLSSYNYFLQNNSPGSVNASVLCLVIQELDANKNVVFEWHSKDYLAFDGADQFWLNSPSNVDWTHSNAIEMDTDGNIFVSSRHFNEITKINRADSTVMWRLGGKNNQFTFTGDTIPFYGQHDIRRIANGNITLYDNGNHVVPHGARALEYQLDEVNKIAELKWSYTYDSSMFAYATGNVQRLPNANTLINYGVNQNTRNIYFNVVDSLGNTQVEFFFDDTLFSYRSYNFELPYSLPRVQITCFDSSGVKYLDAGAGHNKYIWSTGDTTQTIPVSTTGNYHVFVPFGRGGFLCSQVLAVGNVSDPCSTGLTEMLTYNGANIYPNPVHDVLRVKLSNELSSTTKQVTICDASGRKVLTSPISYVEGEIVFNVAFLDDGLYLLRINNTVTRFVKVH